MIEFIDYYRNYIKLYILKHPGTMLISNILVHIWLGFLLVYLPWAYVISKFILASLILSGFGFTVYCYLSDQKNNNKWKEREAKKLCEKFNIEYEAEDFLHDDD